MFDPETLYQEAAQDWDENKDRLQEEYLSESQAYKVLMYFDRFFNIEVSHEGVKYKFNKIHDLGVKHEVAKKLAHDISGYRNHKLRGLVSSMLDQIPAHELF